VRTGRLSQLRIPVAEHLNIPHQRGPVLSNRRLSWEKMFPDDYYRAMFRLWGWPYRNGPKEPR
jgi:hypothetical protein